jgi:ribonuclease Z
MRPSLHPSLVNGRFGDPALFVERLHRREVLLCDLGDLSPLSARDLLRVSRVFVTHCHIDHFIGLDALMRVSVGREKVIHLVGPAGIRERVWHKLQGYEWDLVGRYDTELVFRVCELSGDGRLACAVFRFSRAFAREDEEEVAIEDGVVAEEPDLQVRAAVLDHHGPCLGFAIAERTHVNVWKSRLEERGLPTGPWLQALKQAVIEGRADDHPVSLPDGGPVSLGEVRDLVSLSRGQKVAYVTDVADTPVNRKAICQLANEADILFIESRFAAADADRARDRAHLTTAAAGAIARAARIRRLEPFHFSPKYEGEEARMLEEVAAAFGRGVGASWGCAADPL